MADEIQISTLVDAELRRRFDIERASGGVNVKNAISEAIELWIAMKRNLEAERAKINHDEVPVTVPGQTPQDESGESLQKVLPNPQIRVELPISPENESWVRKFLYILQHGPLDTVEAILKNVEQFSLLARLINQESEAHDELDRLRKEIATDPKRGMERIRELDALRKGGRTHPLPHEKGPSKKGKKHPPPTGTGGRN
jgi:hypothetical protein